ncbi:hypothetical protein VP01_1151g1 [Puccinia sorghi]|uniref:Uncharacterized protein n=1 Tax=Puccinia sorghi TaxID=27349 RepID=A0A0L6VRQ5_9BASI|nr:hypothetical protein VP01_1151g1 [Puccinia sorghi]
MITPKIQQNNTIHSIQEQLKPLSNGVEEPDQVSDDVLRIQPHLPDITMVQLIMAFDNSSTNVYDFFEEIIHQMSLNKKEFLSCLQIIEGDLVKYTLIERLGALKMLNKYPEEIPEKLFDNSGGVLWNVGHLIFQL